MCSTIWKYKVVIYFVSHEICKNGCSYPDISLCPLQYLEHKVTSQKECRKLQCDFTTDRSQWARSTNASLWVPDDFFFFCLSLSVLSSIHTNQRSGRGGGGGTSPFVCSAALSTSICHGHTLSTPLYYGSLDNTGPHRVDLASTHARYQLRLG